MLTAYLKGLPAVQTRPYQITIVNKTLKAFFEDSVTSLLIEAPCGAGKTIMGLLTSLVAQREHGCKSIVWLTMKRNLLTQVAMENESKAIGVNFRTVCMYDRSIPKELVGNVDLLVVDESQHNAAPTMTHIFNVLKPKRVLGMTMTPYRSDCVKLCFQRVVKDAGIRRLIYDGYLSKFNHYTVPEWNVHNVTNTYLKNRDLFGQSFMYFHTHEQCRRAAFILNKNNVKAVSVIGTVAVDPQLQLFREKKLDVIVNCMKLNEGVNIPEIKTVFARPSYKGTTIQMCGRVLRVHPDIKIKHIVQCTATEYPFTREADAYRQFKEEAGNWKEIGKNENVQKMALKMTKKMITIKVELPKFLTMQKEKKTSRRQRRVGSSDE